MEHNITFVLLGLVVSLVVLILGAERFTHCAEKIGVAIGLPGFVIGVLIISLGTTLPELMASIFAVIKGSPTIVAGSVVGSNVANTLLVMGIASLFYKDTFVKMNLIHVDIPFLMAATLLFVFMCYDGDYSWADGAFSLLAAGLYVWDTLRRKPPNGEEEAEAHPNEEAKEPVKPTIYVMLVASGAMLYFGGEWTVEFINDAARIFDVNQGVVAGTAVSLAVALPEVLIASKFARKGKLDVAIGNVVGASIVNCLVVMGLASFFGPSGHLDIAAETIRHGLPMMVASVLIFSLITVDKVIAKTEGVLFLMIYVYYVGDIIGWL